jgi:subtilisin family serine protease
MPLAVNISYGTSDGGHDGESLFETYIDEMSRKGKCSFVVAGGNEGAAGHHYMGNLESFQTSDIPFAVSGGYRTLTLTLWKNFTDAFSIELILPSGKSTGIVTAADGRRTVTQDQMRILISYGQPNHYNESQEIFIRAESSSLSVASGIWNIRVRAGTVVDGRFNIWLPVTEIVGGNTAFLSPSEEHTLTLPSCAASVITVGGYDHATDSLAVFSGRGYTRDNALFKPDIVAPAVGITAARSGGGYDSFTGTSFAAPFVTGAAALMMQWGIIQGNDRFLFGQRIKAYLKLGAQRKSGITYPDKGWGYGRLCFSNTLNSLKSYNNQL